MTTQLLPHEPAGCLTRTCEMRCHPFLASHFCCFQQNREYTGVVRGRFSLARGSSITFSDDLPPRRQIAVPSEKHIDELRAPAPEVALARFRDARSSQGGSPPSAAGVGNSDDMAMEQLSPTTDGEEQPAVGSKRSASSGVLVPE